MQRADLPFLDIAAPGFSTRGPEVMAAREASWCARTPYGLAVLRHKEAGTLLRDRRLRQGSHNWPDLQNFSGSFADFWCRSIIGQEGEVHKNLRRMAQAALSNEYVLSLRPEFRAVAAESLAGIRERGAECEFIADFSAPFAGRAVTTLLQLPKSMAAQVGDDAWSLGLAMAVDSRQYEAEFNAACDRLMALAGDLVARARRGENPDSYPSRLVAEFEKVGYEDEQALLDLILISIFGGVDTTRAQLGFAIALFAENPDQWQMLRADRDLIPPAIEDAIRTRPTTTWSTRQALESFKLSGVEVRAGDVLHIFAHATARDPAIEDAPEFDITKKRKIHFGFGGGAHHCLGQFVARTDIAAALDVIADHWQAIEWAGVPEWLPESGNTAPAKLPIRPVWA